MSILAIIPARGGSKEIKRKNLKKINNKTLLERTIDEAKLIKDKEIAEILDLPPIKLHCSVLAEDCIRQAVEHWEEKSAHRKHNELGGHA